MRGRPSTSALVVLVVAAVLTACSSSASGHGRASLTGFGATRSEWNRTHTPVRSHGCIAGQAYDADPRLRAFPGCPGSKYVAVDEAGGRIDAYVVNFPAGTTPAQVLRAIRPELPGDAVRTRTQTGRSCTLEQFRSVELAKLDPVDFPGGRIGVQAARAPDGRRFLDLLPIDIAAAHVTPC